ncbi:hypothetical protein EVAR_41553_1 [Eumeta japonica]|uniref:Mariner Mos1 transposase n=1 Tax=Eumeta variegata TaxID=151549 RepID=A0A4C1Y341_EUMVA|nr:hypothetical protein EVAR_41553_1 [Eumeta japonica]
MATSSPARWLHRHPCDDASATDGLASKWSKYRNISVSTPVTASFKPHPLYEITVPTAVFQRHTTKYSEIASPLSFLPICICIAKKDTLSNSIAGNGKVTAYRYANKPVRLPEMIIEFRTDNAKSRITSHHDNASSHTAHKTDDFARQENDDCLIHSSYHTGIPTTLMISLHFLGLRPRSNGRSLSTSTSYWNFCFND